MKNLLIIISTVFFSVVFGQRVPVMELCPTYNSYPLRTFTQIPTDNCSYLKDTNNELQAYEGTWKGSWNNKTILITFKKITNKFDDVRNYNRDYLIGKFIVKDNSGAVLFDNTSIADDKAKIEGGGFRKVDDKYTFIYIDSDLCDITGNALIKFTDPTKSQLEWKYYQDSIIIDKTCFYHSLPQSQRPDPLPKNIILVKQ